MSPGDELEAIERGAGVLVREGQGVFTVTGADAADFLHRMLTQDVRSLRVGQGRLACFTDRMAKVVAPMVLLRTEQGFLGLTDPDRAPELTTKLRVFVFGAAVTLADRTAARAVLGLHGPGAAAMLEGLGAALPGPARLDHGPTTVAGLPAHLVRVAYLGAPGFDLVVDAADLPALREALGGAGATPLSAEVARALRVEAGTPVFGVDYDGESMPPEVGLGAAVSYNKGCYIGQEILERLRSRGKTTRLLRLVELPEAPAAAGPLEVTREGKVVGRLTSLARSPRSGRIVGLASLPAAKVAPGDGVEVGGVTGQVREVPA